MKPVDQTKFLADYKAGPDQVGNCFPACVASILELPLEEIPNFCAYENWYEKANEWLNKRDLCIVLIRGYDQDRAGLPCICIATGKSPRGDFLHCVVWKEGRIVHDPHPSRDGIVSNPEDMCYLVPLDPKHFSHAKEVAAK